MSLSTQLGAQGNLLEEHPEQARLLKLESPSAMAYSVESSLTGKSDLRIISIFSVIDYGRL